MATIFHPSQFTATPYATPEDKARYANHFARFARQGCRRTMFPKWFYRQTSFMWGHIAEFSQDGFYATWLSSDAARLRFFKRCETARICGDPAHTYSDVERALSAWVSGSGFVAEYQARVDRAVEVSERAELARLQAKYPEGQ